MSLSATAHCTDKLLQDILKFAIPSNGPTLSILIWNSGSACDVAVMYFSFFFFPYVGSILLRNLLKRKYFEDGIRFSSEVFKVLDTVFARAGTPVV